MKSILLFPLLCLFWCRKILPLGLRWLALLASDHQISTMMRWSRKPCTKPLLLLHNRGVMGSSCPYQPLERIFVVGKAKSSGGGDNPKTSFRYSSSTSVPFCLKPFEMSLGMRYSSLDRKLMVYSAMMSIVLLLHPTRSDPFPSSPRPPRVFSVVKSPPICHPLGECPEQYS